MAYLAVTVSDTDLAATLLEKKKTLSKPQDTTRESSPRFRAPLDREQQQRCRRRAGP
jgi:hypothetical protein